ncbi:hypothetical protein PR202_ga26808 [Eleusine coracana subsp. coracana]|uniref:Uncharacterized protein n=1 Tax=Eleusine coracana subsp. coracana TaxID=191504 RepID=A0AAV5DD00_ELECO|nr:hypothetical protein PR202_ga26808 [Eleusine coracana subsp. coracana]
MSAFPREVTSSAPRAHRRRIRPFLLDSRTCRWPRFHVSSRRRPRELEPPLLLKSSPPSWELTLSSYPPPHTSSSRRRPALLLASSCHLHGRRRQLTRRQ